MLVVSLALGVVLASGNGDDNEASGAVLPTATRVIIVATPTSIPAPTETPAPTAMPTLTADVLARVQALPEKLRGETLAAYSSGELSTEQLQEILTDYENRNPAVRVGTVKGVSEGSLRFEVFTTGEEIDLATNDKTQVRRADHKIALTDLTPNELVMVTMSDDGKTALSIDALGVAP
jgi:hypothetical protein